MLIISRRFLRGSSREKPVTVEQGQLALQA